MLGCPWNGEENENGSVFWQQQTNKRKKRKSCPRETEALPQGGLCECSIKEAKKVSQLFVFASLDMNPSVNSYILEHEQTIILKRYPRNVRRFQSARTTELRNAKGDRVIVI